MMMTVNNRKSLQFVFNEYHDEDDDDDDDDETISCSKYNKHTFNKCYYTIATTSPLPLSCALFGEVYETTDYNDSLTYITHCMYNVIHSVSGTSRKILTQCEGRNYFI